MQTNATKGFTMETYTFEAQSGGWTRATKIRLAELNLDYSEIKSFGKSTFVVRLWDEVDVDNMDILIEQIQTTMDDRRRARAARRAREKAAEKAKEEAKALAKANFIRLITFRKPLNKLS